MRLLGYILIVGACVAGFIGSFLLYFRFYSDKIRPRANLLSAIAARIRNMPPCDMENLNSIHDVFKAAGDGVLTEAFVRYRNDATRLLNGEAAPEASGYFNLRSVYSMTDEGQYSRAFRSVLCSYALFVAISPLAWTLIMPPRPLSFSLAMSIIAGRDLVSAFALSLLSVMWFVLVYILISILERKSLYRANMALYNIGVAMRHSLPTSDGATQAALLLKGVRQTGDAFAGSAAQIVAKIDSFATDTVMPAATKAFDLAITEHISPALASMDSTLASLSASITDKQENGMRVLVEGFGERLYGIIGDKMVELGKSVETVNVALSGLTAGFADFTGQTQQSLAEDRTTLKAAANLTLQAAEAQRHSARSISEFSEGLTEARLLTDSLREQSERILASINELIGQNNSASEAHVRRLEEGREQLSDSLRHMREVIAENAALLTARNGELDRALTVYSGNLERALTGYSGSLERAFAGYNDNLERSVAGAAESISGAYEQSRAFLTEQLAATGEAIKGYLDAGLGQTRALGEDMTAAHSRLMEEERAGIAAMMTGVRGDLSESLDSMKATLSETMGAMGRSLAETLESTRETMSGIAGDIRLAQTASAEAVRQELSESMSAMSKLQTENAAVFYAYGDRLDKSFKGATELITRATEESRTMLTESLAETGGVMKRYIDASGERMETVAKDLLEAVTRQERVMEENLTKIVVSISSALRDAMESNAETAAKLAKTVSSLANAGTEQYEKAAQSAAALLNNIVSEINRAMEGVGQQISESIGMATGESAVIVNRLAEQTAVLKQEYDTYFGRLEEQNRASYDELDFHMQNVTARFAEEAMGVIGKLQESISDAMRLYEGNTATLLANLDEQSRAIGLYAKELAFDISSLSTNLRETVAEFSEHVHQGVVRTFDDFDNGLSEVSRRLANTVESIRDSVENLPLVISGAGNGDGE